MQPKLKLRGIVKRFHGMAAVDGVDLAVRPGEFVSLLGPSGCGKSTLLAVVSGLLQPDAGQVLVDGRVVNDVPPQRRRLGLVFQDYAVFSRLTVRQNLLFGLKARRVPRAERERRIAAIVEKLALGPLMPKLGGALNMSEMQRVAFARVLVTEPELLLLDEPMSNLDAALRTALRTELKQIQTELRQTVLYVTHDQAEAMALSDRIAVMRAGRILQIGSPDEIYRRPETRFVAEFIGDLPMNLVPCEVIAGSGAVMARTALHGPLPLGPIAAPAGSCLLGIRPHDVMLVASGAEGAAPVRVRFVENLGAEHIAHVEYGDRLLALSVPPHAVRPDDTAWIALRSSALHLIRESDGTILRPSMLEAAA
jgi:ABC-type sugar transport system ATPase subunit